ncbi:hypothetical protein Mapa_009766 [Marchantia paleacea]|nr:hypothetical protein Mapa_009766 [Marchantia paleacea]
MCILCCCCCIWRFRLNHSSSSSSTTRGSGAARFCRLVAAGCSRLRNHEAGGSDGGGYEVLVGLSPTCCSGYKLMVHRTGGKSWKRKSRGRGRGR